MRARGSTTRKGSVPLSQCAAEQCRVAEQQAPSFKKIANTPGMSVTALTVWSRTTHPTMPNLIIEPDDMDDLIAYILSLKDRK